MAGIQMWSAASACDRWRRTRVRRPRRRAVAGAAGVRAPRRILGLCLIGLLASRTPSTCRAISDRPPDQLEEYANGGVWAPEPFATI